MAFILDGTTGIATVNGSVSAPSQRGQDTNSGISYAEDTIKFSTNGIERLAITNSGLSGNGSGLTGISAGKILQVVSVTKTGQFSSSSTSFTDITGCTLNITPSSSSNKIFVTLMGGQWGMYTGGSYFGEGNIVRDSTQLVHGIVTYREGSGNSGATCSLSFLDSPNTSSQVTYKAQVKSSDSSKEVYPTGSGGEGLTITAMEVEA